MSRSESIIVNQMLLRKIVYAVNKAITQDVPQVLFGKLNDAFSVTLNVAILC